MTLRLKIATLVAAATLASSAANATTITIQAFDITAYTSATSIAGAVTENFETTGPSNGAGILPGTLSTAVGDFSALTDGGTKLGDGSTCQKSLTLRGLPKGSCDQLALFDQNVNGQGNLVPTDGKWSLNSNDTLGIFWAVDTGSMFNRIVFGMMDAADTGAKVVVTADGVSSPVLMSLANANEKLIVIDFSTLVSGATVEILSSKRNDALSIDGVVVGVVPVPAAGFLLLGGLGALAAVRRRSKAA